MKRRALLMAGAAAAASGCGGVPLGSIPRLARLQGQLLELDPAELRLAILTDARLAPPVDVAPLLIVKLRPAQAGAFEPMDLALPMRVVVHAGAPAGLRPPGAQQRWWVYGLPPASQDGLRKVQARIRRLRSERNGTVGGSVAIGIEQTGLAPHDPDWQQLQWQTWLQSRRDDGFFELWSGTIAELRAQAESASKRR